MSDAVTYRPWRKRWTPEAREVSRKRALAQWTPEARKQQSTRMAASWAERHPERAAIRARILAVAVPAPCEVCRSSESVLFVTDYVLGSLRLALPAMCHGSPCRLPRCPGRCRPGRSIGMSAGEHPDREVRVGLDYSRDHAGTWRLTVECDDEMAEMVFMTPPGDPTIIPVPVRADLESEAWTRPWIEDHYARCESCRAWAAS